MSKRYRLRRLLAPTAGFRNALVLLVLGLAFFAIGSALSFQLIILPILERMQRAAFDVLSAFVPQESLDMATHVVGGGFLVIGFYLIIRAVKSTIRHIFATVSPDFRGGMVDVYVRRQQLAQGPRIVALGGGTGLSTLLRGLKQHSSNITAIVTVTDDGGSSGRLAQEIGIIPPGDIRNCLVALADAEKAMTDLFQHRFKKDAGTLSGHSMGNLLIAALVEQAQGDFERAIEIASDVLAIRGRVIPATLAHVRLKAIMENGEEIFGETAIAEAATRVRRIFLDPGYAKPHASALAAIKDADLICIGPGSVYTSVIPNVLVPGIAQAIHDAEAVKVYICNVMTQKGESDSFTASEHVAALQANLDLRIMDYVMVNTGIPSPNALTRYRGAGQFLVEADIDRIRAMGYRVLSGDFMNESDLVRHDPMRVAASLIAMANR